MASKEDFIKMIKGIGDILDALTVADPRDKANLYDKLGLKCTYQQPKQTVRAES